MKIENVYEGPHPVTDWEFQFQGGAAIAITVDETVGDSYRFNLENHVAYFNLTEKASPLSADSTIPAEELIIPMRNVLCVRKSVRYIDPPSVEQKEEWRQLLQELVNPELAN